MNPEFSLFTISLSTPTYPVVNKTFLSLRLNFLPILLTPCFITSSRNLLHQLHILFQDFSIICLSFYFFLSAFKTCSFRSWKQFKPVNQTSNQQATTRSNPLLHLIVVFIFFHGPNSKMCPILCCLFCITSFTANLTVSLQHFTKTFYLNFLLSEHCCGPWECMLRNPHFSSQISCIWYLKWNYVYYFYNYFIIYCLIAILCPYVLKIMGVIIYVTQTFTSAV